MRCLIVLSIVCLGVFLQTTHGEECTKLKLNFLNYGESWFVAAEGDTNGPMALRFSENQEYFFNTGTTSYYDITFTENTSVDRLKARFMNTSSVTVDVYQKGSTTPDKTITKPTGGSEWDLYRDPFIIELDDVRLIRVTWVENDLTIGIKKLVVVVCESHEPCIEDQVYNTTKDLDLPIGFTITVPGPALQSNGGEFSTDPRAVMDGAKAGGIQLTSDGLNSNYIEMFFDTAVTIRTFNIFLKNAEGLSIECFNAADELIYSGSLDITRIWMSAEKTAFIGNISGIRRVKMLVSFDLDLEPITAKRLYFSTCQQ